MSLITYVLLCALCYGTSGKFNPEVIPDVTTWCVVTQVVEVGIIWAAFQAMKAPVVFLDLFAYTGYKYVGLCVNLLIGIVVSSLLDAGGTRAYYVTFLGTAAAVAYFMSRTMAHCVPNQTAANGPKREVVVLAIAAMQVVIMWWLGQTKFLESTTSSSSSNSKGMNSSSVGKDG